LHDRTPVILKREKYDEWLAAPTSDSTRWMDLLVPFDVGMMMKRFPVSSLLNDPQNDSLGKHSRSAGIRLDKLPCSDLKR
jgi:putative SOS response-associated peptidase YedK